MNLEHSDSEKQDKPMKVHLARLFKANICLAIYYLSPNIISFLVLAAATALSLPGSELDSTNSSRIDGFLKPIIKSGRTMNKMYSVFCAYPLINKILVMLVMKVGIDFLWLFPTWFVIFCLTQVLATWNLLNQMGVVELALSFIDEAVVSLKKLKHILPQYQAEK